MKKYPFYTVCMIILLLVSFRGITHAVQVDYTFDLSAARMVGSPEIPEFELLNLTGEFTMSVWDINEDLSNPFWLAALTDVSYTFEGHTFVRGSGEWKQTYSQGGILTVNFTDPDTGIVESYSDGCQITIEKATVIPVPEPSIMLLLFSGFIGLVGLKRTAHPAVIHPQ